MNHHYPLRALAIDSGLGSNNTPVELARSWIGAGRAGRMAWGIRSELAFVPGWIQQPMSVPMEPHLVPHRCREERQGACKILREMHSGGLHGRRTPTL